MADALLARLGPGGRARVHAITQRVFLDFDHGEDLLRRALADAGDDAWWRGRLLELLGWLLGYRGRLAEAIALAEALGRRRRRGRRGPRDAGVGHAGHRLAARRPPPARPDRTGHGAGRAARAAAAGPLAAAVPGPPLPVGRPARRGPPLFAALATAFSAPGWSSSGPTGWPTWRSSRWRRATWPPAGAGRGRPGGRRGCRQRPGRGVGRLPGRPGAAHRGDAAAAQAAAGALLAWGEAHDNPPRLLTGHHVRGVVALAAGDGEAAVAALAPASSWRRRSGHRHPGYVPFLPDAVEARGPGRRRRRLRRAGRRAGAQAAALGEPWVDAAALARPGPRRCWSRATTRPRRPAGRGRRRLRRARLPARRCPHPTPAGPGAAPGRPAPGGRGVARRRPRPRFAAMEAAPWAALAEAEASRVAPERAGGR